MIVSLRSVLRHIVSKQKIDYNSDYKNIRHAKKNISAFKKKKKKQARI